MGRHLLEAGELTGAILGAAVEVHKTLGPGYVESVYANALSVALTEREVSFVQEHEISLEFHGHPVGSHRLDFLVDQSIVLELKSVEKLAPIHVSQVRAYLISAKKRVGLLLNFNEPVLSIKRVIHTPTTTPSAVFRTPVLP
jgi:GxxExxY protein